MGKIEISEDMDQIRKKIKHTLEKRRYEHTIGVSYTAAAMAMRYDLNVEQARLAGLLHDCAKYMTDAKIKEVCVEHHIEINETEQKNAFLLHAKLGAYMAEHEYGVEDPDILSAIRWHTTGHPDMTPLEKIIFVADYIEPNRQQAPHLKAIRHLAFIDLDEALRVILKDTLDYLNSIHGEIDGMTEETYLYYMKEEGK
ncbi:MAG: bis(5'-nucleosyl)-tetraphosphatase (symmetrical) YqeK [bacterium]|nr:bis(5'-nucleosyl)-tetraphosphatase (symmetrical) YqeK [bacterium]